jgi:hypothetical protein
MMLYLLMRTNKLAWETATKMLHKEPTSWHGKLQQRCYISSSLINGSIEIKQASETTHEIKMQLKTSLATIGNTKHARTHNVFKL